MTNILKILGIILFTIIILGFLIASIVMLVWKPFFASSKWVDVQYWKHRDHYKAKVDFATDLSNISAIHIHKELNGKVGPIIAWLATSSEWQTSSAECDRSKISNENCSITGDIKLSGVLAPEGTPLVKDMAGKSLILDIPYKNLPNECDAIKQLKNHSVYLVVHGKKFTTKNNCIDILDAVKFY